VVAKYAIFFIKHRQVFICRFTGQKGAVFSAFINHLIAWHRASRQAAIAYICIDRKAALAVNML